MSLLNVFMEKVSELVKAEEPGMRWKGDQSVCFYCGKPFDWDSTFVHDQPIKEHVWPKSSGGSKHASNLVWACRYCNRDKGVKHPLVWLRDSSFPVSDNLALDLIARVFIHLADKNDALFVHKQRTKLLAWAHLIIETLEGEVE